MLAFDPAPMQSSPLAQSESDPAQNRFNPALVHTHLCSRQKFQCLGLEFELQVWISSLGVVKSWSRSMRSLETQNSRLAI